MIIDAHTHNPRARQAIINVAPAQFVPQPGLVYAVGIHPWQSQDANEETIRLLGQAASHEQVVAIGETGLDSLRGAPLEKQRQLLDLHIALAQRRGKPLVMHMVRTSQQLLQAWRHSKASVNVMIHGMRSNERVARPLIDAGFYLSFGIHFNPRTLHATPLDHLLIETDDSTDVTIEQVAQRIAQELGMTTTALLHLIDTNAQKLLQN